MNNENIEDLINKIKEHEVRISKLERFIQSSPKNSLKALSLREFLNSKNPDNDVEKTICICYFLEIHERMESFNKNDIEGGFREAKEKVPDNINYKVYRNIKNGYLMEVKERKDNLKAWTLTNSGIKYIENYQKEQ